MISVLIDIVIETSLAANSPVDMEPRAGPNREPPTMEQSRTAKSSGRHTIAAAPGSRSPAGSGDRKEIPLPFVVPLSLVAGHVIDIASTVIDTRCLEVKPIHHVIHLEFPITGVMKRNQVE